MTGKEVLRAIADGADVSEFEVFSVVADSWQKIGSDYVQLVMFTGELQFRRKPRTRVVNGFTVPAPIDKPLCDAATYFLAKPLSEDWFDEYEWNGSYIDRIWFSRGLLFSTKEAAIANAKAMCGINPESEA